MTLHAWARRVPFLLGPKPRTTKKASFRFYDGYTDVMVPMLAHAHALEAAIGRGIHIGRHRTLTQDSEFGIAQVIEIAIRALSPAINDTFTGVACVDWLADALFTLAERL